MTKEKKGCTMRAQALIFMILTTFISATAQVTVTVLSATGKQGDTVEVPLAVGDISSSNIIAFQFTIGFNHYVLTALDPTTTGTLAGQTGWTTYVNVLGDSIRVAAFGSSPLVGSGTLIKIKYRVEGSPGANTPLTFSSFIFNAGNPTALPTNSVFNVLMSTGIDRQDALASFDLLQNYPNPFNPHTTISFYLPQSGAVSITVYNAQGELIDRLDARFRDRGYHSIIFDGTRVASGIYFYRIEARGFSKTRSMLLLR
jgi:hypothetical protein